ncbi:MEDS domain-containing protein [Nonomuraea dietziae]|uniref:MEDS domain-containing protein n=1 Tax=Nonomuraea dietziae TaxID=65515 RepID=UPI0033F6D62E
MRQIKDVKLGDHVCLAFAHEAEQRAVVTAFLAGGLESRERVLYFSDAPGSDRVRSWLEEAGVDVASAGAARRLEFRTAQESYLPGGRFDPDTMIEMLRREVDASLAAGWAGLRVSGEMSWALAGQPGSDRLEDYERRVTGVYAVGRAVGLCQYDARLFPAERLTGLTDCHPEQAQMNALFETSTLSITPTFDADGARVLRVTGTVDHSTTPTWSAALRQAARAGGDVRVDMAELEFIDVAGIRELAAAASALTEGSSLRIRHLAPRLRQIITLVGWDAVPGLVIEQEAVRA